jgi:hypothetical protein
MSAEIIPFGTPNIAPRSVVIREPADETRPLAERAVTAKNVQLRRELQQAWRKASAATNYWQVLLKFCDAAPIAARAGVCEACLHSCEFNEDVRRHHIESYREAVCRQILTPAPDITAVHWKRGYINKARLTTVIRERLEQVIADDLAFLKAHPTQMARAASDES